MSYEVRLEKSAERDLKGLSEKDFDRIIEHTYRAMLTPSGHY